MVQLSATERSALRDLIKLESFGVLGNEKALTALAQRLLEPRQIELTTVDIRGDKVRHGITASREIPVHRKEILEAIRRERRAAGGAGAAQTSEGAVELQPAANAATEPTRPLMPVVNRPDGYVPSGSK